MRIVIYGLGKRFLKNKKLLENSDIVGVCDQKKTAYLDLRLECPYFSKKELKDVDCDFIVVTSSVYFDDIFKELVLEHSVSISKVIRLEQYMNFLGCTSLYLPDVSFLGDGYNLVDQGIPSETLPNCINYKGMFIKDNNNENAKIFVVSHRDFVCPAVSYYEPLWVGDKIEKNTAKNEKIGDNISHYNSLINEATALYWIWKNDKTEIVGLNHYRRYFQSQLIADFPMQVGEMKKILCDSDVIVAKHVWFEQNTVSATLRGEVCEEAYEKSYNTLVQILGEETPESVPLFLQMIEGRSFYPCEMFVMKRTLLNEYCEWLFPVVFKMIDKITVDEKWDSYSKRIIGFWIERLFSVWIMQKKLKVYEVPILQIETNTKGEIR